MLYKKKCDCKCGAKLTLMYSGKIALENLKRSGNYHKPDAEDLMISVEGGNPWMMISMTEISQIIKELQESYKEYEEFQEELKKSGKLEDSVQDIKANLSEKGAKVIHFKSKKQGEAEDRFFHLSDHLFPDKIKGDPENSA